MKTENRKPKTERQQNYEHKNVKEKIIADFIPVWKFNCFSVCILDERSKFDENRKKKTSFM